MINKFRKKYQKIVDELIKKSFPELRGKKVKVDLIPKWLVWWVGGFVFKRFIFLTENVNKITDKSPRVGIFVHELCHVEDSIRRNYFKEAIQFIREVVGWFFGSKYSFNVERKTDIKSIKKGYARELFEYAVQREKRYSKGKLKILYGRGYLSSQEIKSYAKKIKKW